MQVTLLNYTQDAAALLVFTKNTRLEMSPSGYDAIKAWSPERLQVELAYIARTVPSSHEFVDYTFAITGVTRAFTHQLVRTRTGSYAQQAMRVVNMAQGGKPFAYATGATIAEDAGRNESYRDMMNAINGEYNWQIENGASTEDARGILPTNILTNIVAKFNLRTMADLYSKRSGVRVQDEYRSVLFAMVAAVLAVHPWAEMFIMPKQSDTVANLESLAARARQYDVDLSNAIAKEADLLKKQAQL